MQIPCAACAASISQKFTRALPALYPHPHYRNDGGHFGFPFRFPVGVPLYRGATRLKTKHQPPTLPTARGTMCRDAHSPCPIAQPPCVPDRRQPHKLPTGPSPRGGWNPWITCCLLRLIISAPAFEGKSQCLRMAHRTGDHNRGWKPTQYPPRPSAYA